MSDESLRTEQDLASRIVGIYTFQRNIRLEKKWNSCKVQSMVLILVDKVLPL